MDGLCDEILQLILVELDDPTSFTLVSKRFYHFSQDPYVRATYFLSRHGQMQAIFWAFGRGKLINEKVIDILISCGAYLSRYLVQVAIHHYFRTQAHFVKTTWVRSMSFPVFSYFMIVAARIYGDIPTGKGEDDGSTFASFLTESRFPSALKSVPWEEIRDIIEKYKDPVMVSFPLALAIEPRLLPYAKANGFHMDSKYRDFVFRKMFERPSLTSENRTDEIVRNVRELCRLDPKMFLTRTVAAEICMEAKANEGAYTALKQLDKSGNLLFEIRCAYSHRSFVAIMAQSMVSSDVVRELTKMFVTTRSITTVYTINVLRQLWADYPSDDPTVRLVMLLTVFLSDNCLAHTTPATLKTKLDALGLTPLSRKDIYDVLINPFVERYTPILEYGKVEVGLDSRGIKLLLEEVTLKCLEINCKGKMLKKLLADHEWLKDTITDIVPQRYQIRLEDLPPSEDEKACAAYEATLSRDFVVSRYPLGRQSGVGSRHRAAQAEVAQTVVLALPSEQDAEAEDGGEDGQDMSMEDVGDSSQVEGRIGQDTLTTMIQYDELAPTRTGRRRYHHYGATDSQGKLTYPADAMQVGRWVRTYFGNRSPVTAIFVIHGVINDNVAVLQPDFGYGDPDPFGSQYRVPITLKHFKILQRLGRAPNWSLYHEIQQGAEFYFTEEDYITQDRMKSSGKKVRVKTESTSHSMASIPAAGSNRGEGSRGKKRPRRSAAASVKSYAIPDSDDETIAEEDATISRAMKAQAKKKKFESNLQQWIKHLSVILKEEKKKYKEQKKRLEKTATPGSKVRLPKNEFHKSLTNNLRDLRKRDREKRRLLYGSDVPDEDFSEGDDDEYHERGQKGKKRRISYREID
ncbi:hypothetical protein NEOLEDRAFT_1156310 [Neolentinus lepideus HHB14362 ss-1]|uniref:Uncharacterized protein n=1 Tax=Neolentinus lepideus HHB14362 ss-1 TaxID=1314782 RepID=A0A165SMP3_9AGAM|nr:hypothetical protein NEOLEDRAFT_1156310 [Neolentinus lepideus HHB14362 ss-1]